MHQHLKDDKHDSLSCPICAKLLVKVHVTRHGNSCLLSNKLATYIYSWVTFDKKYWCLICSDHFSSCALLVAHYLNHDERDNNILGMTRFMLKRGQKSELETQSAFMKKHLPEYRINSRPQTAYPSQAADQLDFLTMVAQANIHAVCLASMFPN